MTVSTFTPEQAAAATAGAAEFIKLPNPVRMVQQHGEFGVATAEGPMHGNAGDWLCYDAMSGHAWVVSDDYKRMHYAPAESTT